MAVKKAPLRPPGLRGAFHLYTTAAAERAASCGSSVCLSVSGSTMVDEVVGYACGGREPDLTELSCGSVTPSVNVSTEQCGCSGKTNVTVYGCFEFSNLPSLM